MAIHCFRMGGNLSPRFATDSEDDLLAANETAVPTHAKSKREDMISQNCLIYLVKISIDEFRRDTSNQEQEVREVAVSSS